MCIACRVVAMAMGVTLTCTRAEVLQLRALADRRDKPTARYWGERITGWREWMGDDNRWHAQLVLEDGTQVYFDEPE